MKRFLVSWALSVVLVYCFLFLGGYYIFENFAATIVFIGFFIALAASLVIDYETRISKLENRLKELEGKPGREDS